MPHHRETVRTVIGFLDRVAADAGGVVVDGGCGTGLAGLDLRRRARRLIGVDLSSRVLAFAAGRGVYDELAAADVVEWLERARDIDLIVAVGPTYFMEDLSPFLKACRGSLRDGGTVMFADYPAPESQPVMMTRDGTKRFCHSAGLVRSLAGRNGLAEIAMDIDIVWGLPCHLWAFGAT